MTTTSSSGAPGAAARAAAGGAGEGSAGGITLLTERTWWIRRLRASARFLSSSLGSPLDLRGRPSLLPVHQADVPREANQRVGGPPPHDLGELPVEFPQALVAHPSLGAGLRLAEPLAELLDDRIELGGADAALALPRPDAAGAVQRVPRVVPEPGHHLLLHNVVNHPHVLKLEQRSERLVGALVAAHVIREPARAPDSPPELRAVQHHLLDHGQPVELVCPW
mmetsp:Transcript_28660/g.68358  ORF Transcript_28660/g.68358 Transcript_28660/m.68358 type:complete len:223 (-) Transcript_28660:640-1308(-)